MMIEDQLAPKRCGHTEGKQVVERGEALMRLKAAVDARNESSDLGDRGPDRCAPHARVRGSAGAARAFAELGADVVFVEALESVEEMRAVRAAVDRPLLVNLLEGGKTPILPHSELDALGFKLAAYPLTLLNASIVAMQSALAALGRSGHRRGCCRLPSSGSCSASMLTIAKPRATARRAEVAGPQQGELVVRPIGVVHSPFVERQDAPRQAVEADVEGTIELYPQNGIEHALEDLSGFSRIWVVFWFHHNQGWTPKVRPPRSVERRGVFATRAPYRPNPIGMSAVELVSVEGLVPTIKKVDMLDGTPVLDLKPYIPYTDSFPEASSGWLDAAERPRDPGPRYVTEFAELAEARLRFWKPSTALISGTPWRRRLALGPAPHPYRRIKRDGEGAGARVPRMALSVRERGERIVVLSVRSGNRASEIMTGEDPKLHVHRAFDAIRGRVGGEAGQPSPLRVPRVCQAVPSPE